MIAEKMQKTIIHVDDDPTILRLVHSVLTKRGYDLISVDNPEGALQIMAATAARVMLLDMDMAGKDGLTLLREIKSQDAGIQVIILTGVASIASVVETQRLGAEECLFKPVTDLQLLIEAIERSFVKLERWWETLRECQNRSHASPVLPTQKFAQSSSMQTSSTR